MVVVTSLAGRGSGLLIAVVLIAEEILVYPLGTRPANDDRVKRFLQQLEVSNIGCSNHDGERNATCVR